MMENITEIRKQELVNEVKKIKDDGYRFITSSCVDMGSEVLIYYHFDKENNLKHLKLTSKKEEEVPSISKIYLAAALVENEMKDFFGLNITDLAIDYKGKFLITSDIQAPMLNKQTEQEENKGEV